MFSILKSGAREREDEAQVLLNVHIYRSAALGPPSVSRRTSASLFFKTGRQMNVVCVVIYLLSQNGCSVLN